MADGETNPPENRHTAPDGFGPPVYLRVPPDAVSERMEADSEARTIPRKPNPHDD